MINAFPPNKMLENKNKTIYSYGRDERNIIPYTFNSNGFRSNYEFSKKSGIGLSLGNSIGFALGLQIEQSYNSIVENERKIDVYNFSIGCYSLSSEYQYFNLVNLLEIYDPQFIIFQINNLYRISGHGEHVAETSDKNLAVEKFIEWYEKIIFLTKSSKIIFVYWDNIDYNIPLSIRNTFTVDNKYHLDSVTNVSSTFGPISNKLIAKKIISVLE